jgi:beta-lactamase class A
MNTHSLQDTLENLCADFQGVVGYALWFPQRDLAPAYSFQGDTLFPSASLIKVAILCTAFALMEAGERDWAEAIPVISQSGGQREPGGISYALRNRTFLPLCEWLHLMVSHSDNTATVVLKNLIGQASVNAWLYAQGFRQTRLLNGAETAILGLEQMEQEYGLGVTTPNEMARLLSLLARGEAVSPSASERMVRILRQQYWDDYFVSQIPPHIATANMTGSLDDSRSDAAIVFAPHETYILVALTKRQADTRWENDNAGDVLLRKLSRLVWQTLYPTDTWAPTPNAPQYYPLGS